jgi:hypothetical protein
VQTTAATYQILLNLDLPEGATLVYLYGAQVVSGDQYSVNDWRFAQGLSVPAGMRIFILFYFILFYFVF